MSKGEFAVCAVAQLEIFGLLKCDDVQLRDWYWLHLWSAALAKGNVGYVSVSQLPGRGPVPGPGINYTGQREILL